MALNNHTRDPTTSMINIDQSKYVCDILIRFNKLYKVSTYYMTPMDENLELHKWTKAYDATLSGNKEFVKTDPNKKTSSRLVTLLSNMED
jgi:hypothetical protein